MKRQSAAASENSIRWAQRLLDDDPEASARAARLRYLATPGVGGFRREKSGRGFRLIASEGGRVPPEVRDRVHALVIPPAWRDVWIAPTSACHLQVTGRDAAGRKQYIYHDKWRVARDQQKYARLVALGRLLPGIRRRVARDLSGSADLSHARVMASLVRLLESTLIRVGNDEYARSNQSFGLTTIRKKHVAHFDRRSVVFDFTGKSAKKWRVRVFDPPVIAVVRQCLRTPGHELFKYFDASGSKRDATSADVNEYLREVAGAHVTAKDFRTLGGTLLAGCALTELLHAKPALPEKKLVLRALQRTADCLNNTPQICRSSYVHPAILDGSPGDLLALARRASNRMTKQAVLLTDEERSAWAASARTPAFERAVLAYVERRWHSRSG
ncbi:MAG TPA: DNA topoisomerase IB [Polyangiaceae bacterium]